MVSVADALTKKGGGGGEPSLPGDERYGSRDRSAALNLFRRYALS
jgi:hypothetical protein